MALQQRHIIKIFIAIIAISILVLPTASSAIITNISVDSSDEDHTDVAVSGGFLRFGVVISNYRDDTTISGNWSIKLKPLGYSDYVTIESGDFVFPPNLGMDMRYISFGLLKRIQICVDVESTGEYFCIDGTQILGFVIFDKN